MIQSFKSMAFTMQGEINKTMQHDNLRISVMFSVQNLSVIVTLGEVVII